jgi:D-3-phosphoglycerate dehydrogenase / 2-oxoglutarate reductase
VEAIVQDRAARARTAGAVESPSVLAHELLDPSGSSLRWLEEQGVRVDRGCPTWGKDFLSEDERIERGRGHVALMGASTHPITARVLEELPEVAFVSKYGIGVDSIDMEAATRLGVLVTNTPISENWDAVAEWTVAAMLALRKQLLFYTTDRLRSGGWRTVDAWSSFIRGRTVGIVGFGRIGRSVAKRLAGWDCEIVVCDPYLDRAGVEFELVDLDELLRRADVISLHAVVTPETRHMIDAEALAKVKPGTVLINSARGALMDLDDVYDALEGGRLAGVAMDAYESEPPAIEHPIFRAPNVIATPHASAWVEETFEAIAMTGAENLWAGLSGGTPRFAVNAEVLSR